MENNELTSMNKNKEEVEYEKLKENKYSKFNLFIATMLVLLLLTSVLIYFNQSTIENNLTWEYKVIEVNAGGNNDRIGSHALNVRTINIDKSELNRLGQEGWELVSSYLEMETAYPNFGDERYVTGLQPNIRPQKVVLIFKRPLVY